MNQLNSTIKIIVCVPYVRTFVVLVRKTQKINIIKEAFPNISYQNNLIYWFDGSQLSPNLTFNEIAIQEYSAIVVTAKTDNISFNKHFMKISKYGNIKKVLSRMIRNEKNEFKENRITDQQFINTKQNYELERRKYFFIQNLKDLLNQFDFSKNKTNTIYGNGQMSINSSPIHI